MSILRTSVAVRVFPIVLAGLLVAGCEDRITGPAPEVASPAAGEALPVDPGLICADQLTTDVAVHGAGFSPLPIDVPGDPRAALPTVTLTRRSDLTGGAADALTATFSGEPDGANGGKLTWQSQAGLTFTVDQDLALDGEASALGAGVYDVTITNANTNEATTPGALAVAPRPTAAGVSPGIVCLAEEARTVTVAGTTFLRLGEARPTLAAADATFEAPTLDGCAAVAHAGLDAAACTSAAYTLPVDALAPGLHELVLTNPETAACHTEETVRLRVVPPPSVDSVEPSLVCTAQGDREVVVHGQGFLEIDDVLPTAALATGAVTVTAVDGCQDLETDGAAVRVCDALTVTIPQQAVSDPAEAELTVTNPAPAGCSGSASTALALAPPPMVTDIAPPAICDDGGEALLTLAGTNFLVVDGTKPHVRLNDTEVTPDAVTPGECTSLTLAGHAVEQCASLAVSFFTGTITTDSVTVSVENPAPAGCSVLWDAPLPMMAPPEVLSAAPSLVCTDDGGREIVLTGTSFFEVDGTGPTVALGGTEVGATVGGCTADTLGGVDLQSCTELTLSVPQGTLSAGDVGITVTNPAPFVCAGSADQVLDAPPALTLASATPTSLCTASPDTQLALGGTGFLSVDGALPAVTLNGTAVVPDGLQDCTALTVAGATVEACDTLLVTVASGSLAQGPVTVSVTNPGDASCGSSATGVFHVGPVPTLASIEPTALCTTLGGSVTVTGTGFEPGTSVVLTRDGTTLAPAVTYVSETELTLDVPAGTAAGHYDVTVSNGPGCEASLPAALQIDPRPFVFFIDPPVAYDGISIQATIYTSGLTAEASTIRLLGPNGETLDLVGTAVGGEPNRISVTLPGPDPVTRDPALAPGLWDLEVTSRTGCVDTLQDGLRVTDTTTLALESIDPAYLSRTQNTAVSLFATDPTPAGQTAFAPTPRAYLSPTNATTGSVASKIDAVDFVNAHTLTGVVGAGLDAGAYDLIVVNPAGEVGVLTGAVTVTTEEPPRITSVVPGSLDANTAGILVTLGGSGFGNPDPADPTGQTLLPPADVAFTCRDPSGVIYTGDTADGAVSLTGATATTVDLAVSTSTLGAPNGSVCVVTVTNPDGASYDYSAVSMKNPSANLYPWNEGGAVTRPALVEARRALGLVAGRPTGTSRFLYAIGGDDGFASGAKASVETANVGVYGDLSPWALQRSALPAPRTAAGVVRVGQFVYAVGGDDGTGAVDTILRAQILDPLATPAVQDLSLAIGDGGGSFGAGFWYYRISAVFPDTDPSNPGGESLPGEPLVVQLPDTPGIELTLQWDAIPGASGYRIYRTPTADLSSGEVELLAEVQGGTTLTYRDRGDATDPAARPLPMGSLGVWHDTGTALSTPRSRLAVATAPDPDLPGRRYLYAVGGRDASGAWRSSLEVVSIDLLPPAPGTKDREAQTIVAAALGTATLAEPRADLGTWRVTHDDVLAIPEGHTWIYLGPGSTSGGGDVSTVEAFEVPPGGDPAVFTPVTGKGGRTGAGYLDGNGFLFLFGGGNGGTPSSGGVSAEICRAGGDPSGCSAGPPELRNWTSEGTSMSENRVFMGTAQESAFFFVAGGCTASCATAPNVTRSVDQTVK